MKLTLPFDRLAPFLRRLRLPALHAHAFTDSFPAYLKRRLPGLFYDPSRRYMRGPGPKASLKQKSSRIDSKIR
jgi:hypothetical protein